jgi:hypothetical protein
VVSSRGKGKAAPSSLLGWSYPNAIGYFFYPAVFMSLSIKSLTSSFRRRIHGSDGTSDKISGLVANRGGLHHGNNSKDSGDGLERERQEVPTTLAATCQLSPNLGKLSSKSRHDERDLISSTPSDNA